MIYQCCLWTLAILNFKNLLKEQFTTNSNSNKKVENCEKNCLKYKKNMEKTINLVIMKLRNTNVTNIKGLFQ